MNAMEDIILTHVSKAFDGKQVLRDLSLTLPAGRVTCVMAPSGAGKTTLLRILLGLIPADAGTIRGLEGARIAAVFQEDRLIPGMDPVSNIRLVRADLPVPQVISEMESMGLTDCASQPVRELSGGMKRRVALLRALLSEWDFLVLDEPFKGLDEESRERTIRETLRLIRGRTVLMVTHDPEEARQMQAMVYTL